jgi:hypothetical protein
LILGAQVNNSSAWAAMLPKVWPAIDLLGVCGLPLGRTAARLMLRSG